MKFCPQCGTTFENNARFCLECGFDKSSVETFAEPIKEMPSPTQLGKACPKCGTVLVPDDRFCLECGFDTEMQETPVQNEIPKVHEPIVVEVIPQIIPNPEPQLPLVNKAFCPKCGSTLAAGERFCEQCGFDTLATKVSFKPVEQPMVQPQATYIAPVAEPKRSPEPMPVNSPAPAQAVRIPSPPNVNQPKAKKKGVLILLIVVGLGILGTAAWFGYSKYASKPDEVVADTISNAVVPETPVSEIINEDVAKTDQVEEAVAEPPTKPTKPLSRIDQELAKQKAKQQSSTPKQTTPQAQPNKPDLSLKVSPAQNTANNNSTKVLHEVGQSDEAKNKGPKKPTKFTLSKPTMIVRITTDHYNGGMGTPSGGSIIIKDKDENMIGSFKAIGKSGKNGTPNSKWVAEPHKKLEKGTYYILDTDVSTWSKNILGIGFVVVEGYEVE